MPRGWGLVLHPLKHMQDFQILTKDCDPDLVGDVMKLFDHDLEVAFEQAALECAAIGRANLAEGFSVDGVGPKQAALHPLHVAAWRHLGVDARNDPEALKFILKQEGMEYAKVQERGTKVQSGYTGRRNVRSSTSYG